MRLGNLSTALPRARRAADPMAAYDGLPPVLRRWLAHAVLPWSARSAARAWSRALRDCGGDEGAALARLDRIEAATLARDRASAWSTADTPISRAAAR